MSTRADIHDAIESSIEPQHDGNGSSSAQGADKGVRWEEPPKRPRGHGPRIWEALVAPLMVQPGRWARLRDYPTRQPASSSATNLKLRAVVYPAGRWQFVTRKVADGFALFGRYLGPDESK